MKTNAINTVLSEGTFSDIKSRITETKQQMPFLVALTAKERKYNFKLGTKRLDFTSKVVTTSQNEPVIIPSWIDIEDLKNDYFLSNQLFAIENMLESLLIE